MLRVRHCILACVVGVAFALPSAAQDTVSLKNGDRLTGTIHKIDGANLVVDVLGSKVKVPLDQVDAMKSEQTLRLNLTDGSIVTGRVESDGAGGVNVITPEGPVAVGKLSSIAGMYDPANPPNEFKTWIGKLTASAVVLGGNSRQKVAHIDGKIEGRFDPLRLRLEGAWDYGTTRGELSTRRAYGVAQLDWTIAGNFYAYGRIRGETDEFQDLTLRMIFGAGVGYRFIDTADTLLDIAVGASWIDEDNDGFTLNAANQRIGNPDRGYATADGSLNFRQVLTEGVVFTQDVVAFQSLEEQDDFRGVATSGLSVALTDSIALSLQFIFEYDNLPAPGNGRKDWRTVVGATYNFW